MKKAILTVLEVAAILAIAMYLFQFAVCILSKIWWVLLIMVVAGILIMLFWRWWKDRNGY